MFIKQLALSALLAASAATMLPVAADAAVDLSIRIAPPAPRVEVVPAPRHGYVWAPGYWRWRGHQHVWVQGHYVRERRGYHWVPEHWEQAGPDWRFRRGYWER
jgi:WXXGXW repeat (2 copies)